MDFWPEVSSCASRPIEAVVWINEIESAKSIADLKTSHSVTGAKLQSNFGVLGWRVVSRRTLTETVSNTNLHRKEKRFLTASAVQNLFSESMSHKKFCKT